LALIADIASTIYPQIPFTAFVILLGVLITSTALYGFDAMQTISYISIPVVILVFLFGTIKLGINFTGSNPTAPTSFTAAIGSGTSYWLAAAVISGDWLRYSDSYKTVAASATVGLFGVSLLFVSLGFFTVLATGTANIVRAMVDTGIIFPAAIGLLGLVWTTVDNELYSASLGIANIFETKKIFGVIVAGGSVLVLSGFKFHELILPYVTAIGVLIPPIPAIWLVEYYIFRNRMKETNIDRISYKVNWLAIISCIGGSVTGLIVPKNYVAPIISMMITDLTYLLLVYTLSEQDVYPRTLASSPR
jgi:cytosine permease